MFKPFWDNPFALLLTAVIAFGVWAWLEEMKGK
jgi:hypothetical protein